MHGIPPILNISSCSLFLLYQAWSTNNKERRNIRSLLSTMHVSHSLIKSLLHCVVKLFYMVYNCVCNVFSFTDGIVGGHSLENHWAG